MPKEPKLSRRQREILEVIYACGEASILEIQERLDDAPSTMAIRRMVTLMEEKELLNRRKVGREFLYSPRQAKRHAGANALKHVVNTFFDGSVVDSLASHLGAQSGNLDNAELQEMLDLIEEARAKGN